MIPPEPVTASCPFRIYRALKAQVFITVQLLLRRNSAAAKKRLWWRRNSAGQAAVFLAQNIKHLYLLVRGSGLADRCRGIHPPDIEQTPNITLLSNTELVGLEGSNHLERVKWRNNQTGDVEHGSIAHVFVMTGAEPNTGWLNHCIALDDKGFIKTGPKFFRKNSLRRAGPSPRAYLLETSLPGVLATGDVRAGNVKRVASAVGEGSIAISFVHQVLKEQ